MIAADADYRARRRADSAPRSRRVATRPRRGAVRPRAREWRDCDQIAHLRSSAIRISPTPMPIDRAALIPALKNIATRLRIDSIRVDVRSRQRPSDELLLGGRHHGGAVLRRDALRSEGSAAIRTAIASCCRRGTRRRFSTRPGPRPARSIARELLKLREIDSDLEGHPTPRLPFVDVATGSLGQGICAAIGIALNARRIKSDYRTYVLLGDGEIGRRLGLGSGRRRPRIDKLDNLCGITDVNGARPEPRRRCGSTTWSSSRAAGARSAGTRSSSTATT